MRRLISWYEGVGKIVPVDPNADVCSSSTQGRWAGPQDNFWTVEDVRPYLEVIAGLKMTPGVRQALENVRPNGQRLFSDEELNDPNFFVNLVTGAIAYFALGYSPTAVACGNHYGVASFDRQIAQDLIIKEGLPQECVALGVAAAMIKEAVSVKYEQALGGKCVVNQERLNVAIAIEADNGPHPLIDQYLDVERSLQEVCPPE